MYRVKRKGNITNTMSKFQSQKARYSSEPALEVKAFNFIIFPLQ